MSKKTLLQRAAAATVALSTALATFGALPTTALGQQNQNLSPAGEQAAPGCAFNADQATGQPVLHTAEAPGCQDVLASQGIGVGRELPKQAHGQQGGNQGGNQHDDQDQDDQDQDELQQNRGGLHRDEHDEDEDQQEDQQDQEDSGRVGQPGLGLGRLLGSQELQGVPGCAWGNDQKNGQTATAPGCANSETANLRADEQGNRNDEEQNNRANKEERQQEKLTQKEERQQVKETQKEERQQAKETPKKDHSDSKTQGTKGQGGGPKSSGGPHGGGQGKNKGH